MQGRRFWAGLMVAGLLGGCAERERPRISDGLLQTSSGLDFGVVAMHSRRDLEISLRNVGRTPINIQEIWTEGPPGTYQAKLLAPGPQELRTGTDAGLRVRYTPQDEAEHPGTLMVRTDSRDEEIFKIEIHGKGLDARARVLSDGVDFGRIEADSDKTVLIAIENPSSIAVEVAPKLIGGDKSEFGFDQEQLTLEPGERRDLAVRFHPSRVGRKDLALAFAPCLGCVDQIVPVKAVSLEQAVIAEPTLIDFGQVPVDREEVKLGRVHNISTEPMDVTALFLHPTTDPSFTPGQAPVPVVLQPDQVREFEMRYSPGHMGQARGGVGLRVASKRHPTTDVQLQAYGGSSELCVSPLSFDFGKQPIGGKATAMINVKNCGASNAHPLVISGMTVGADDLNGGADQFQLAAATFPRTLNAGEGMDVKLFFEPSRAGLAGAMVTVTSNAFSAQTVKLAFRGTAELHRPCDVMLTPALLDFGTVPPGRGAVLGIKVTNRGTDLCAVKNLRLESDAGGRFKLPGIPIDGLVMDPGNAFSFQVSFTASNAEPAAGVVSLELADPANPVVRIPLKANVQDSCLVATPRFLDFGMARPDCPPKPLQVNLENTCPTPITVRGAAIGPGTTDGEFTLGPSAVVYPLALAPGDALSLEVAYGAMVPGMNLSPLFVDLVGLNAPLLVPLLGESSNKAEQTDKFVQQDGSKVDVLFVVDNTASMVEEQPRLINALPNFIQVALAKHVDLHVAVTTTGIEAVPGGNCPGGAAGGEAGRLFPANGTAPRLLTSTTPNLAQALAANARVGNCATVEKGLEAMRRALTAPLVDQADDPRTPLGNDGNLGFLREEAALAVVFVGDEDDHSPDDVETYVRFLQQRKGAYQPGRASVFAIAPTAQTCATAGGSGTRYADAAARTGGEVVSICASDYAPLLGSVASKAFAPADRFALSALPDPGTLEVSVDGVRLTSGWTYDPAKNQVIFTPLPAAGARLSVYYRKACP